LSLWAVGFTLGAFGIAVRSVARQRCGGRRQRRGAQDWVEWITRYFPQRRRPFASAVSAHFWFEWRRSGILLPLAVAVTVLLVIAPLSWHMREEKESGAWILMWTVAMPILLALPIGKGFSKPDFWS